MIWLVGICGVMLFISAILVLWRINDGPNTLDRMVGVDVMTSILLGSMPGPRSSMPMRQPGRSTVQTRSTGECAA